MAAEFGSSVVGGGGGGGYHHHHHNQSGGSGGSGRLRRPATDHNEYSPRHNQQQSHHHQLDEHYYMEDPDLDVSSIVTEFVPLDDPFVPYFDATSEEIEGDMCAPLEASFASSLGEYARFRPGHGYPPNTSTPRFSEERMEVPRGCISASAAHPHHRLDESLAEMMESCGTRSPKLQLVEHQQLLQQQQQLQASPSAAPRLFAEPQPQLSMLDQFLHSISRLVTDAAYARTTNCFKSKIPREVTEDSLISFLTHCVRYPMRRPVNTLLQARTSPLVLEQVLKTAMDPAVEPYESARTRDSYFRITMKNTVHSLAQLYQIVRGISLQHRGFVDVNYSPVRGRLAFLGFNGNLPIRMSQPICSFIQAEEEARGHLNALFSTEISLSRCGDDAREVYITYFDNIETHPRTGQQQRVTEVNIYHIIHPCHSPTAPAPSSSFSPTATAFTPAASSSSPNTSRPPPPMPLTSQTPQRGGSVTFPSGSSPAQLHDVHVERPMLSLSHMQEPTYTLNECFQLSRSYPQHKW